MDMIKTIKVLGLFSEDALYGVDVAMLKTDGVDVFEYGASYNVPYENSQEDLTDVYIDIVTDFVKEFGFEPDLVGVEAFKIDVQKLADATNIKVVSNFAKADILSGGKGGPLEPIFYASILQKEEKPTMIITIGGVTNLIWIGCMGEMIAFDSGPGTKAIDDWVYKKANMHMDYNGRLAISGNINSQVLCALMKHKFFGIYPPKIADVETFREKLAHLEGMSLEDGAATATAFVAEAIAYSASFYLQELPKKAIVCGGGANNPTLLRFLRARMPDVEIHSASEYGLDNAGLAAQVFAFLAARRLYQMPASFPMTTGAFQPIICGEIFNPK